jgi:hypothetical protein
MQLTKTLLFTGAACLSLLLLLPASASDEKFRGPDNDEDRARLKSKAGKLDRFEPGGFWPCVDGEHINAHGVGLLHENGIYYMVGERRAAWASEGVNLYSSTDLYNWKLEGNILPPVEEEGHDIEKGCIMERPKILFNEKTGKYVLWFHLELANQGYRAARVGVAQSDNIKGPYEFVRSMRPNGHDSRDMTVFKDEDGTAYLIYASEVNFMLRAAQLTDDYLDVTERDEGLFRRHREAPAIIRHNGKLFLFTSACTSWDANPAALHLADSIWGPWEHLPNPAKGDGGNKTFYSQPAHILPIAGKENAFIYIGDRWRPGNLINSPHVWLPIEWGEDGLPFFRWHDQWDLSVFESVAAGQ